MRTFYDPDHRRGRMTTKWGGFVSDVARSTPRNREAVDPPSDARSRKALERTRVFRRIHRRRRRQLMGLSSVDTIVDAEPTRPATYLSGTAMRGGGEIAWYKYRCVALANSRRVRAAKLNRRYWRGGVRSPWPFTASRCQVVSAVTDAAATRIRFVRGEGAARGAQAVGRRGARPGSTVRGSATNVVGPAAA